MRRADTDIRTELDTRLAELERQNPEWRSWLGLLRETRRALDDAAWEHPVSGPEAETPAGTSRPLLHGRELLVDSSRLRRLVRRLAEVAGTEAPSLAGYRPSDQDALALVEAAVRQDRAEIEALAEAADPDALSTIAQLVALPLLHASARQLAAQVPAYWPYAYCPICAAWPLLAELRGLDRTRWLRCGRCGGAWQVDWLRCPYCGEAAHERLGSLVPEAEPETRKAETCSSCRRYLKSVTTLQAIPLFELLLRDLETVELDLEAVDRGYTRPQGPGFALKVRVRARPPRSILGFGRRA